jgi:SAM-dependent methyltransferase
MSGFSASWLALREPYDLRARSATVLAAVAQALAALPALTIVDLACGTGSTLRALAPHLPAHQNWKLVDNDLGLLARAANASHPRARVTTTRIDLVRDLEAALDGPLDLVTTSGLLDLVSDSWLERLATEVAVRGLPFYAGLSYDGRVIFEPSDPLDTGIIAAVNNHQRRDKGFGPALGPNAAKRTIAMFEAVGYFVVSAAADWVVKPHDGDMLTALVDGWASAVREVGQQSLPEIVTWLTHRRDALSQEKTSIRVGHIDVFAAPIGRR